MSDALVRSGFRAVQMTAKYAQGIRAFFFR
jgi:hypothetical protein